MNSFILVLLSSLLFLIPNMYHYSILTGYAPDECGCCSSAVNSSFIRTVTTSFGSICFGSFLVAILQALRAIANSARENGDAQIFACIAECILGCLAAILEYFNKVTHIAQTQVYERFFVFIFGSHPTHIHVLFHFHSGPSFMLDCMVCRT